MSSKRAEILNQLLGHIATDNYDKYDRYIIFGASSVFDMIEDIAARPSEREDESLVEAAHELVSDLTRYRGRSSLARRVSLHQPPPFEPSSERSSILQEALEKHLGKELGTEQATTPPGSNLEDAIDAVLTEEVLGKLPKMVDRTLRLDEIRVHNVP